jgi:hypothetical protein
LIDATAGSDRFWRLDALPHVYKVDTGTDPVSSHRSTRPEDGECRDLTRHFNKSIVTVAREEKIVQGVCNSVVNSHGRTTMARKKKKTAKKKKVAKKKTAKKKAARKKKAAKKKAKKKKAKKKKAKRKTA